MACIAALSSCDRKVAPDAAARYELLQGTWESVHVEGHDYSTDAETGENIYHADFDEDIPGPSHERYMKMRLDRNNMVIGAQSNFHYAFIPKLDTYAGLTLGYEIDPDGFYLGAQIGTRYFFNNHWALGAEFGYGVSFAKIGVTYKF